MDPNTIIKFSRNGVEVGEYKLLNVEYQLALGVIKSTDHYWHEGMTQWAPTTKLLETIKIKNEQAARAKKDEEVARAKKEEQRNYNFECNCCRGSFPNPEGALNRFVKGGFFFLVAQFYL